MMMKHESLMTICNKSGMYVSGIAKYELGEYQQAIDCHLRAKKLTVS